MDLRFDQRSGLLAAIDEKGTLICWDLNKENEQIFTFDTELYDCEIIFHPENGEIIILGHQTKIDNAGFAMTSMVLFGIPKDFSEPWKWVIADAEPPYSSPCPILGQKHLLLVGSALELRCLDLSKRKQCSSIPGDDYVGKHSIIFQPSADRAVAVWCSQAGSSLQWLSVLDDGELVAIGQSVNRERESVGGIAMSPDQLLLATTYTSGRYELDVAASAQDTASLGYLIIYDHKTQHVRARLDIFGFFERDFDYEYHKPGEIEKRNKRGEWISIEHVYSPKEWLSNPVFVNDTQIALGKPGGEVVIIDCSNRRFAQCLELPDAVKTIDYYADGACLGAASKDGTIYVWRHNEPKDWIEMSS
jgi:WD40 repeat protein